MRHLGVEIEFTGVKRSDVVKALETLFHTESVALESTAVEFPYIYHHILDNDGNKWVILRDRSILAQYYTKDYKVVDVKYSEDCGSEREYMCELVSPVLDSKSILTLFTIIDVIKSMGGLVNSTCGIHVHIDALDFEEGYNLFQRFVLEQNRIMDNFGVTPYRREKYCKEYMNYGFPEFKNYDEFFNWLHRCYADSEDMSKSVEEARSLRYYGLNFYSLFKHKTIEYRIFNATLEKSEIAKILKWVLDFTYPYEFDEMKNTIEMELLREIKG